MSCLDCSSAFVKSSSTEGNEKIDNQRLLNAGHKQGSLSVQFVPTYVVYVHDTLMLVHFTGCAHSSYFISGAQSADSTVLQCYCHCASFILARKHAHSPCNLQPNIHRSSLVFLSSWFPSLLEYLFGILSAVFLNVVITHSIDLSLI